MALWAHSTSSFRWSRSDPVPVLSGVPQGSVLGPILLLIFINYLPDNIRSSVCLFADDCVLYRNIYSIYIITISDNMDWGQHISEISSKATKALGFLRRNLAFAPKSTKKVAYKTLVQPKLEFAAPIWSPYSKLQINQVGKVQEQQPAGPAGDGEIQVVSARCLMSLSDHLLRPVGINPPCLSFIRYILVLCL